MLSARLGSEKVSNLQMTGLTRPGFELRLSVREACTLLILLPRQLNSDVKHRHGICQGYRKARSSGTHVNTASAQVILEQVSPFCVC